MRLRKYEPSDLELRMELEQTAPLPKGFESKTSAIEMIEMLDQTIGDITYFQDQEALRFWIRLLPKMRNMGFGKQALRLWMDQKGFQQNGQLVVATLEDESRALESFLIDMEFQRDGNKNQYFFQKDVFGPLPSSLSHAFLMNVTPRTWEAKVHEENLAELQIPGVLLLKTIANVDVLSEIYEPKEVTVGILVNLMKDFLVYPLTVNESMLRFAISHLSEAEQTLLLWKSQRLANIPGYDLILMVLGEEMIPTYQTPDVLTMMQGFSAFLERISIDVVNELIQIQIQNAMRSDNPTDLEKLLHRYRIQEPWFLSYYEPCLKANKTNMISWFREYENNGHNAIEQSQEFARLRVLLTKEVRAEDANHLPFWLDFEPSIFQEIAQGLEVQSSDFVDTRFSPLTPNIEENLIWLLQENQLDPNATHQTKSVMSWFLVLGSPTLLEVAFPLWKERKPDAGIQETLMQATFQHDIRSIEYLMPLLQKATLVQWGTMIRSALAEDKIENVMYFIKHVPLTQEWVIQATQDRLLISARDHQYHAFVYLVRFFFHPNVIIDGVPLLLATIAKKNVRAFEWLVAQEETKLHPISFQYTALRVAAHVDFIEAVVYLKEHGVPLDVKGKENHAVFGISKKKSPLSYRYLHSFDPKYGRLKDILEIIGYGLVLIACGVALFFLGKWKGYY